MGLWTTEPGPPNPSRCFSHDRTEGRGKGPDDTLLLCCHIHHRQIVQSDTSPGFGYGMNQWTRGGGGMYDTLLSDTLCPNGLTLLKLQESGQFPDESPKIKGTQIHSVVVLPYYQ